MATVKPSIAQEVARTFAERLRGEPAAKRLWVWSQRDYIEPGHDYVELWLVYDPDDEQTNERLIDIGGSLHECFPEVNILIWRLPGHELGNEDHAEEIRQGAVEVPLHTA